MLTYCFAININFERTINECSIIDSQQISQETVADRLFYCREICMLALDHQLEQEGNFGDVREIVEVDECQIGRRKYEKIFLVGSKRNKDIWIDLSRKIVVVVTEIHYDYWKGYVSLAEYGYVYPGHN